MEFINWLEKKKKLKEILEKLNLKTKPLWGQMDSQQMIEHLIYVFEISNGVKNIEDQTQTIPYKKAEMFLKSKEEMPKNFSAKFLSKTPNKHKFKELNSAISNLILNIDKYNEFWRGKEQTTCNHPVFGQLNKEKWNKVHNKHITHHLKQFDLI